MEQLFGSGGGFSGKSRSPCPIASCRRRERSGVFRRRPTFPDFSNSVANGNGDAAKQSYCSTYGAANHNRDARDNSDADSCRQRHSYSSPYSNKNANRHRDSDANRDADNDPYGYRDPNSDGYGDSNPNGYSHEDRNANPDRNRYRFSNARSRRLPRRARAVICRQWRVRSDALHRPSL